MPSTPLIVARGMYLFRCRLGEPCKQMAYLLRMGCLLYVLGFVAWNVDNQFCPSLRWARNETAFGKWLGSLLQMHGWWHLGTGMGSYYFLVFCQMLRVRLLGLETEYELVYKCKVLPVVVRTKGGKLV